MRRLTEFCRARGRAYSLIATDSVELSDQVDKLQHLRFAHLLIESETIPDRGSQRFNVWLLDVAELSAQRAAEHMDFLGWEEREKRRNRKLIFTGEESLVAIRKPKSPAKKTAAAASPQDTEADGRLFGRADPARLLVAPVGRTDVPNGEGRFGAKVDGLGINGLPLRVDRKPRRVQAP